MTTSEILKNAHRMLVKDANGIQQNNDDKVKERFAFHAAGIIDTLSSIGMMNTQENMYWYNIMREMGANYE